MALPKIVMRFIPALSFAKFRTGWAEESLLVLGQELSLFVIQVIRRCTLILEKTKKRNTTETTKGTKERRRKN